VAALRSTLDILGQPMSVRFDRRLTYAIAAAACLACVSAAIAPRTPAARAASTALGNSNRPNIVVVMTDDQALTQVGSRFLPNITKLIKRRGTSFPNAYLTTPLCCPSRATLLTGQYGHNNGVLTNRYGLLRHKSNVLPSWLQRAGYVTAHVGKFLNLYHRYTQQAAVAPGWDQWYTELDRSEDDYYRWDQSRNGKIVHHGEADSDYAPRVFQRDAVHVVRRFAPRRKPLYLELDEIAPHAGRGRPGTGCTGSAAPAPGDVGKFSDVQLPRPPSFNEANMSDKPSFLQGQPKLTEDQIAARTRSYQCGLAALQSVDRTVARLVDEFRRLGELGETVFVFYTDNGIFYGEHRLAGGKLYPYEEADKTPLYIRLPARYRAGADRVPTVSEEVANIDFAPTILRLAGASACVARGHCRVMDGRSLVPLLRGQTPAWSTDRPIGVELRLDRGVHPGVCQYTGVRIPGAVYVEHQTIADPTTGQCVPDGEHERYDLNSDPFELDNLCTGGGPCPADATQLELDGLLEKIRRCTGIRGRDRHPPAGRAYCG
jgi:N-acetylglucosamine-6-sulfatase